MFKPSLEDSRGSLEFETNQSRYPWCMIGQANRQTRY